jgi:hypothetical protein
VGLTGCSTGKSGSDDSCEDTGRTATIDLSELTDTGNSDTLDSCPTEKGPGLIDLLEAGEDVDCHIENLQLVEETEQTCTYEYECYSCCGYGRPFLDASGRPVTAEAIQSAGWDDGTLRPSMVALTRAERAAVARYWTWNARAEHSSVAGFHRFALDLLAHGAPPELIARAQRAASQELQHALDCFTLASAYTGEHVRPDRMDLGSSAPIATSLAQLAAWTARDGAVGETLAAYLAERALARTGDEAVRAVLTRIVRDETEHAELAWATLRWAIEVGGDDVRLAIAAVFETIRNPKAHPAEWTPCLAAHGVPSPDDEEADAQTAIARVVLPVARALLTATSAAA